MNKVCMVFVFDLGYVLRDYGFESIGRDHYYVDDFRTAEEVNRKCDLSFVPLLKCLNSMVSEGKFRCGVVVNGITLDILERYRPDVLEKLVALFRQGKEYANAVELIGTTYSKDLCSVYNEQMLAESYKVYIERVKTLFGVRPRSFFGGNLIYNDTIAEVVGRMGCSVFMCEDAKNVIAWRSSCQTYLSSSKQCLLFRNGILSDFFTYRFSDRTYALEGVGIGKQPLYFPFDAQGFVRKLSGDTDAGNTNDNEIYNIWLGADSFGINQSAESGIFDFLEALPRFADDRVSFVTPYDVSTLKKNKRAKQLEIISVPYSVVWSGLNKDLGLFVGNDLQMEVCDKLYSACDALCNKPISDDRSLVYDWFILSDMDYLSCMSFSSVGSSEYSLIASGGMSVYTFFINYMNIVSDYLLRMEAV